eukprot:CAMPEP_0171462162 /NCGR_PEP_ID=MMETSP0945-20130129/6313_1 /TAXON_ID=109269 /ORGANISM="Vaucheria litorea, Strain CCMP2940" /LENGTH=123 /DNA_ID=CAMNT_0011988639 /DNA_START=117 /DNA_END=488 /DNA_ORIENTATION=+
MLFGGNKDSDKKDGNGMNMGSMMDSLKKANEIGKKSKEMQEELEKTRLEGFSANKKVKIVMTGQQIPVSCEIDESFLSEGSEAVQKAVMEAMVDSQNQSLKLMGSKMSELYQGLGLPANLMGK